MSQSPAAAARGLPLYGGAPMPGGEPPRMGWADRRRITTSPSASTASLPATGAVGTPSSASPATNPYASPIHSVATPLHVPNPPAAPEPLDPETAARLREARILAEAPPPKVPFTGAWEAELAANQARLGPLQHATARAQAAMRVAAAVLADAEAEHAAASERRRITEAQLAASSMDGIIGV